MARSQATAAASGRYGQREALAGPIIDFSSWLSMTPKRNEEDSDDAGQRNDGERVYALCDGATRSFLPGVWAEILARHVCQDWPVAPLGDLRAWLAPARTKWEQERRDRVGDSTAPPSASNWWMKTPGRPSGATLFAVSFGASGEYTAIMRGDTCCFHVRGDELLTAMPCAQSSEFTSHPECLMSIAETAEPELQFKGGSARLGDVFFLATDALAKWILERCEAQDPPWRRLLKLDTNERLRAFADDLRESNQIEEDDVSLLVVRVGRADEAARAPSNQVSGPGGLGVPEPQNRPDEAERRKGGADARDRQERSPEHNAAALQSISDAQREASRAAGGPIQGSPKVDQHRPPNRSASTSGVRQPAALSGTQKRAPTKQDVSFADNAGMAAAAAEPPGGFRRERALQGRLLWSVVVPAFVTLTVLVFWSLVSGLWHGEDHGESRPKPTEPAPAPAAPTSTALITVPPPPAAVPEIGQAVPPPSKTSPEPETKIPKVQGSKIGGTPARSVNQAARLPERFPAPAPSPTVAAPLPPALLSPPTPAARPTQAPLPSPLPRQIPPTGT